MGLFNKFFGKVEPKPAPVPDPIPEPTVEVDTNKVKITELNGNVIEVDKWLMLDDGDIVLTTPNSKKYHTHVSCFENWKPEMKNNFTGWTIIKKEDAIKSGMTYCNFCDGNDDITLDDILDDLEYDEEL